MTASMLVGSIAFLLVLGGVERSADVNVLVDRVRSIRTVQDSRPTSRLVVYVVDDLGRPVNGVIISVLDADGRRELAVSVTGLDGVVRFALQIDSDVRVRTWGQGFTASEARKVSVKPGRLVALALALEGASLVDSD